LQINFKQWALENLNHVSIIQDLSFVSEAKYTAQLGRGRNPLKKASAERRIPEVSDSTFSPDKEVVTYDLGDVMGATVGLKYRILDIFTVGSSYMYQVKGEDKYSGSKYSSERYAWMGQDTKSEMETAQAAIGADTLGLYRQKKFPVPLKAVINHTRVLSGKNVISDPLTSLELSVFF